MQLTPFEGQQLRARYAPDLLVRLTPGLLSNASSSTRTGSHEAASTFATAPTAEGLNCAAQRRNHCAGREPRQGPRLERAH